MSLCDEYNKVQNINPKCELEDLMTMTYIRCNNLVVCGDKLPYFIRDIKVPDNIDVGDLRFLLGHIFGIVVNIVNGLVTVVGFRKILNVDNTLTMSQCKWVDQWVINRMENIVSELKV